MKVVLLVVILAALTPPTLLTWQAHQTLVDEEMATAMTTLKTEKCLHCNMFFEASLIRGHREHCLLTEQRVNQVAQCSEDGYMTGAPNDFVYDHFFTPPAWRRSRSR